MNYTSSTYFIIHTHANDFIEFTGHFDEGHYINLHSIVMPNIDSILSIEVEYTHNNEIIYWDIHAPILFSECTRHSNSLIFPNYLFFKGHHDSTDIESTNFSSPIKIKVNTSDFLSDNPYVPIKLRFSQYMIIPIPTPASPLHTIYKYTPLPIPYKSDDTASIDRCIDIDLLKENLGSLIGLFIVNWKHVRNLKLFGNTTDNEGWVCNDYDNDDIRDFGEIKNHPDVLLLLMGETQRFETSLEISENTCSKCTLNIVFNDFTDPGNEIFDKVEIIALSI